MARDSRDERGATPQNIEPDSFPAVKLPLGGGPRKKADQGKVDPTLFSGRATIALCDKPEPLAPQAHAVIAKRKTHRSTAPVSVRFTVGRRLSQ